jgi:hypothetical protein
VQANLSGTVADRWQKHPTGVLLVLVSLLSARLSACPSGSICNHVLMDGMHAVLCVATQCIQYCVHCNAQCHNVPNGWGACTTLWFYQRFCRLPLPTPSGWQQPCRQQLCALVLWPLSGTFSTVLLSLTMRGYVNSALLVAPRSYSTVLLVGHWEVSTVYCQRGFKVVPSPA